MAYFSVSAVSHIPESWPIIAAAILILLTTSLLSRRGKKQRNFPPGPRSWPILGNLHQLGERPNEDFSKLSKIYGPLIQVKFGCSNVVVIDTPEMAREFLKTYDSYFASRPQLTAGKYITFDHSDLTWGAYGHHWRQGRRIFATLFQAKKLELYEYVRVEETKESVKRLYNSTGKPVGIRAHASHFNLSVVSRIVLGRKYFSDSNRQNDEIGGKSITSLEELQEMFDEFFFLNGVLVIGDWIPWLAWLDLGGYVKRMKILRRKFDEFLDDVIQEHREARAGGNQNEGPKKIVDILLDHLEDPDPENRITMNNVKGFIQELLTGGTDTSSTIVEWGMAELMKNPEKMKKAKEELDRVIGPERWAEEKDIPNLPYIEGIMKEAMRLHPASTMLAPHCAIEDCKVQNYDISKGSMIFINTWSIGRDPNVWDCPDEFRPERYFDKAIDIKGQNYELLPFGAGRRMCPGYALGLKLMMSSFANMIHGFNWKLPNEMKPQDLNMEDLYGLTSPMKYSLFAIPEPCLSPHLYA